MSTVYVISDHGKLKKTNETFEFTAADGSVRRIFPHQVETFVISGMVSITGQALRLLMKHKINVVFMSASGEYNGKLVFSEGKNVFLRKKQYALSDDESQALLVAKSVVQAKIKNELNFVQRIKRKQDNQDSILQIVSSMKHILKKTEEAQSISQLLGYEGNAAREYFSVFKHNLIPDWANFPSRSKNPPLTNVNAVLSFLYTLLMYRVETAVEIAGLDTMAGFFHKTEYGKATLVFDLMEEFRTPIADTLCCALFNLGTLRANDFINEGSAVLLNQSGLQKVIAAFEKRLAQAVRYPPGRAELPLSEIIIEQVKRFKECLSDPPGKNYKGFILR